MPAAPGRPSKACGTCKKQKIRCSARNIRSHVLLSICAWGANFYRDESGSLTLKDQGFMIEWAKKAGKLVFQEVEELHEDNLVTFFNLALFWHSQGSWRISYLHKEIQTLALPWPERGFREGVLKAPPCFLGLKGSSQSIFAELIRGLTLWCEVVSAVKSPEVGLDRKIADIFSIENKLSVWWEEKAHTNVGANVRMMQAMSPYWKLASLLELYARCIYDIHQRSPPLITNEPKYADISEFTSFRVGASLARPSILEFTGVLRSSEGGYVRPGEESNTFGIESDDGGAGPSSTSFLATEPLTEAIAKNTEGPEVELGPSSDAANRRSLDYTKPKSPGLQQATRPNGLQNLAERQQLDAAAIEWPTLDVSNSLFDAEMANFFPDTKSIDPSLLDAEPLAWNFLDVPAGEGD
ncbi:hypothetical protein CDV31_007268 [Fusarium ambrosium]|uniref:Zn(2)-C6 fungal-type domain-containing protein n=1 Tax=Fusarium ambrosium TaxID=131363 RepID=A0A428U7V2_9HYPO|nr:hypothetical protein CDV31_007268 [Fusarium ambrosium]